MIAAHKIRFRVKNIHFIGIGGVGMSGIAEVLHNLNYRISGSDIKQNDATKRLADMGCNIYLGHSKDNLKNAEAIVTSSAINAHNPEIIAAKKRNIPIVSRAEMLAEIMRFRFGIAVAGTHGKTTTTSLIAHILATADLDPTYIIGGILNSSGSNAKLGSGEYLVAEADESDLSFLHLQPMLCVITNIDADHMQTYAHNRQKLERAFLNFTSNLPFYGVCVICLDDPGIKNIKAHINRPLISYGLNPNSDICAEIRAQNKKGTHCLVSAKSKNISFDVTINLIGLHNIKNALAAITVALELDIEVKTIQTALKKFSGVKRRLQHYGILNIANYKVHYFDDYAHHPSEIKAVMEGLGTHYNNMRIVVIFEPHRYSRVRDLFDDFVCELKQADTLILLEIYAAGEEPLNHINSNALAGAIRSYHNQQPIVLKEADKILEILPNIIKSDTILLTLGAGDIEKLPQKIIQHYGKKIHIKK